jgi:hypothetical protein
LLPIIREADTAMTGKTMENDHLRWQVTRNAIRVWDLTFAGKRGKKVDGFALYDIDYISDPIFQKSVDQFAFRLKSMTFKDAQARARAYAVMAEQRGEMSPKFRPFEERAVDVAPAGFKPFEKVAPQFTISADWTSYGASDRRDTYNRPACYNTGKRDVKRFYRWVTDNWDSLKRLTFRELTSLMKKEGFQFRSYCSVD